MCNVSGYIPYNAVSHIGKEVWGFSMWLLTVGVPIKLQESYFPIIPVSCTQTPASHEENSLVHQVEVEQRLFNDLKVSLLLTTF